MIDLFNTKRVKELEDSLKNFYFLADIFYMIQKRNGEFICDKFGSGNVTFVLNGKALHWNSFPNKFNGFFINNKKVSFETFMDTIYKEE